jgi:hypothetical protein
MGDGQSMPYDRNGYSSHFLPKQLAVLRNLFRLGDKKGSTLFLPFAGISRFVMAHAEPEAFRFLEHLRI